MQAKHKIKVALKFCGSCNPQIDLTALAAGVRSHIAGRIDFEMVPADANGLDLLIILCGCQRACADKEEIWGTARQHIVTAGETFGGVPCKEDSLAALLAAEIDTLYPPSRD